MGSPPDQVWILPRGAVVGAYRIIEPLGRGGMGEVYLAENVLMGKRYALKILPRELSEQSAFRERFRREGRVMADLLHLQECWRRRSG